MRNAILLSVLIAIVTVPPAGADGMLDPSFGNGGLVRTNFDEWGSFAHDVALAVAVTGDGRTVVAGHTDVNLEDTEMTVARYLVSGELDTSFGADGRATISFPSQGFGYFAGAEAVLLQPDGRMVLVGWAGSEKTSSFGLGRLNEDGSPDASFGTNGTVLTSFGLRAGATAGLLQPDGRIVAVGWFGNSVGEVNIAAARYNPDGSLDPTFGGDGKVTVVVPGFFDVRDVVLEPDGKLVIAGYSPISSAGRNFALARLLPDGNLDPSFGGDGMVSPDFGGIETGRSVILLADGRLVMAGERSTLGSPFGVTLARYLADGSVDMTFGTGGFVTVTKPSTVFANQLILLPNGNLLVAGSTFKNFAPRDFLLARFLPGGQLDTSFGRGGFLRTDFGATSDECNAAALAGPDLVVTAGTSGPGWPQDFALARYIVTTGGELTSREE